MTRDTNIREGVGKNKRSAISTRFHRSPLAPGGNEPPPATRPSASALDHVSREKSRRRTGIKQVAKGVVMIITLEVRLRYYFRVSEGLARPARDPCAHGAYPLVPVRRKHRGYSIMGAVMRGGARPPQRLRVSRGNAYKLTGRS